MLFFEYTFLFVFLPVTLIGYYRLAQKHRNTWLLALSSIFYAFACWVFLPLLWLSILVDFTAGRKIAAASSHSKKKLYLFLSLATNLGLLAGFKYIYLISSGLQILIGPEIPIIHALLPVGISFYTFQSMSYTIDVYRGNLEPIDSFVDFAAFVSMFPQLIAGPIVRFSQIADQLEHRQHNAERIASGIHLFVIGMAKKILVADTLAILSRPLFKQSDPGLFSAWFSMIMFAGQIYFDFSGYSNMAVGLGRLFGFELPFNFNSPYKATSFRDFWKRWHTTLSSWLRDYLYIPMGGNRRGSVRTYINIFVTMLLGGMWHGATWNFLLWGLVHAIFIITERILDRFFRWSIPRPLRVLFIFMMVTIAWVPFRFESSDWTWIWIKAMFSGIPDWSGLTLVQVLGLIGLLALIWIPKNIHEWRVRFNFLRMQYIAVLMVVTLFVAYGRVESSPFLYFRF